VIRLVLGSSLCGATILLALATAVLQSQNRDRGLALDAVKEECDMLEAANGDGCELILARDHGPLPLPPKPAAQPASPPSGKPAAPVPLASSARRTARGGTAP